MRAQEHDGGMPPGGVTIWLTGLPSAGKSTIARRLVERLSSGGVANELLDGDEVRERLSRGLGYSREDRDENIRRISYVARLLTRHGVCAIVAAISPYRATRDAARAEIARFVEVHVDCRLEECIRRDVKGLYRKALAGEISNFTGVSDPYEPPVRPEVVVRTHEQTPEESTGRILDAVALLGYLPEGLTAREAAPAKAAAGRRASSAGEPGDGK